MDAFSFLYSQLLLAKLSLLVFGAILLKSSGKILAYVAALFVACNCPFPSLRG